MDGITCVAEILQNTVYKCKNPNASWHKNAIQRMEVGKRFVTDIELVCLSKALQVSIEQLLEEEENI